ncbi:MAG: hypothetical protein VB997_06715 [Opitutales bacterium]
MALERPLFADKTWRLSPKSWTLPESAVGEIRCIGQACLAFHQALERLYLKSRSGERILRNDDLKVPWVAEYLDVGKPTWLGEHGAAKAVKGHFPCVLRPDLIATADGFVLTEMDTVPGGIGLTAFLEELYLGEQSNGMPEAFYSSFRALVPELGNPVVSLVVSDESATYRPEMEWLAETLSSRGCKLKVASPDELEVCPDGVFFGGEKQDVIYRFWELFDHEEVPVMREISQAVEAGVVAVTPPMRAFQEEKLALGLFWHHLLEDYWRENLSKAEWKLLRRIIPRTWILDPAELPPGAVLDGPTIGGKQITSWRDLASATKKERNLVIKASGFHESAWGARSVVMGSDVSSADWAAAIDHALDAFPSPVHVLQEYRKPARLQHPIYDDAGEISAMQGRLRLSPYYFGSNGQAELSGALATFCPADKKIIHGMQDGVLLPCAIY